jgi:hypothetical protein
MLIVCEVCGNDRESLGQVCPFCGSSDEQRQLEGPRRFQHKTINLEAGRPVVEVALTRLDVSIKEATRDGTSAITLIHGYGSSGRGGIIRGECRKMLDYLKTRGRIMDYIPGEDFNRRKGPVKNLLQRFPDLGLDRNLNRGNRGITLVIL